MIKCSKNQAFLTSRSRDKKLGAEFRDLMARSVDQLGWVWIWAWIWVWVWVSTIAGNRYQVVRTQLKSMIEFSELIQSKPEKTGAENFLGPPYYNPSL